MSKNLKIIMKTGDYLKVNLRSGISHSGLVVPSKDQKSIVLKLDSGYNVGVLKSEIKSTSKLSKPKQKTEQKTIKITQNKSLKKITILHTGGTIASKVDYATGGVIAKFTPQDILNMFPELSEIANIDSRLIANMWSDDARFYHYNKLAKEVEKEVKNGVAGVIITSGTDTMHYTSAALSFILENINVPVLIVGAQRSSDRGSSDAGVNLVAAANFITKTNFVGVAICMHANTNDNECFILNGCKVRKMHTSRRDAFRPININPIASVDSKGNISYLSDYKKKHDQKLKLKLFNENLKVGILKIHTNMHPEQFKVYKSFKGLILEGTGLGHTPGDVIDSSTKIHKQIVSELKKLTKTAVVAMTSQCIYGRINMNVYSKGRMLQDLGIIGNLCDMTPETAFIKLSWLLSNYKKNQIKELFEKDLRGEISSKTNYKEMFI